jgi:hypothetical protein
MRTEKNGIMGHWSGEMFRQLNVARFESQRPRPCPCKDVGTRTGHRSRFPLDEGVRGSTNID